jgi:hypothetical protein
MSAVSPAAAAVSHQAAVEAALVLLERMGLSRADLVAAPQNRAVVPTFAEYIPVVSAAVSAGTRRAITTIVSAHRAAHRTGDIPWAVVCRKCRLALVWRAARSLPHSRPRFPPWPRASRSRSRPSGST